MFGHQYLKNVVTLQYNAEKCSGCQRCTQVCPHAVFRMEDKQAVLQKKDACMECGACEKNCAYGAIAVRSGVGCSGGIIQGFFQGTEATCDCDCSGGKKKSFCC
jgi:NAD-dependent dihydropyrimidine dehydrogenase PreA subunit